VKTYLVPTVWYTTGQQQPETLPAVADPTATPGLVVTVWDTPSYCGPDTLGACKPACTQPHNLPLGNCQPKRRWDLRPWELIHARSGSGVGRFATCGQARRYAEALGCFDWTRHTDDWTETDHAMVRDLHARLKYEETAAFCAQYRSSTAHRAALKNGGAA
jgi:hypothetical protein